MTQLTSLLMYSLYAPTWTARKLDRKATADVKKLNGVKEQTNAGNFNKLILPDCKELDALKSYIGATRLQFYERTAAWGNTRGVRVGKAEDHLDLMSWFGDRRDGVRAPLQALLDVYPEKVAKLEYDADGLGAMFNADDYPPVDVVQRKFALDLSVSPLPNVNDIRVLTDIPAHVRQEIEDSLKVEFQKVQDQAVRDAFDALVKPIAHMATQLKRYHDGETKKVYDSVVENVREVAAVARRMNITRDPTIEAFADEAEALVKDVTKKDLKESDGLRVTKQKAAEDLAARMAKYLPQ
jgi:hypothetical protein